MILWLRLSAERPLAYSNRITSTIFQHNERSVLENNPEKLVQRIELLLQLVLHNASLREFAGKDISRFSCSCYSYLALHLALMKGQRKQSAGYLLKALRQDPLFIFQRRFFAILKHLA